VLKFLKLFPSHQYAIHAPQCTKTQIPVDVTIKKRKSEWENKKKYLLNMEIINCRTFARFLHPTFVPKVVVMFSLFPFPFFHLHENSKYQPSIVSCQKFCWHSETENYSCFLTNVTNQRTMEELGDC